MLNYFIQVGIIQIAFLAVYDLFLRKETFYQWNRAYLILTSILAYLLPWMEFRGIRENIPKEYTVLLPEVVLNPSNFVAQNIENSTTYFDSSYWIYLIGIAVTTALFISKLVQIIWLARTSPKQKKSNYKLITINQSTIAFSFFNSIFIGKDLKNTKQIIRHELVHVKQWHSLDLLFFELLKIVCWFNPLSYVYQNRISELHEFIADEKTVNPKNRQPYFENLLSQIFQVNQFSFVNSFYKKSLIKKRIIMLGKVKSKEILKLKYLLLIPVFGLMLVFTSCVKKDKEPVVKIVNNSNIIENTETVAFADLEQLPIFKGCEGAVDDKACFTEKMQSFVEDNFNFGIVKSLNIDPGTKRVYVQFIIDKEGKVKNIKARGPHVSLEKEAIRVINSLPIFVPAIHNGKKVNVKYTLPIGIDC